MAKNGIYRFIKENYVLDFTVQGCGNGEHFKNVPVKVYRPKTMKPLPEEMKEYVTSSCIGSYFEAGSQQWCGHNPDYGVWDAMCVIKYHPDRTEVYVCSILRQPFTEGQSKFYGDNCCSIVEPYRIFAPWDSAIDSPELRAAVLKYIKDNPQCQ